MDNDEYFLVPCDEYVYKVKKLPKETLENLISHFIEKTLPKQRNGGSLFPLIKEIIQTCLKDGTKIVNKANSCSGGTEERTAILDNAYSAVCGIYDELSLQSLYTEYNNRISGNTSSPGEDQKIEIKTKKKRKIPKQITDFSGSGGLEDFLAFRELLENTVYGQKEAIDFILREEKLVQSGLQNCYAGLLVGPTGTGKTLTAKVLADLRYEGRIKKINCGALINGFELGRLFGAPPGYVGFRPKESQLYLMAEESDKWVFLFDEIEKADDKVFGAILDLLDEFVIEDNEGNECDFRKSAILLTSNIGAAIPDPDKQIGIGKMIESAQATRDRIDSAIENRFTPEFINRFSFCAHYLPLSRENIHKIIETELRPHPVHVNKALVEYIYKKGYNIRFGSRDIKRTIKKEVLEPLADVILGNFMPTHKDGFIFSPEEDELHVEYAEL